MNTSVATTAAPKKEITDLSSMLLPLNDRALLLPGVSVAEIITFVPPEADYDEETPSWFLGHIYWRNQRIPLVAYEPLMGGDTPRITGNCRIAVMNNTGLNHQLSFFALLLQGTPRLLRIIPEEVRADNEKVVSDGERLHVQVLGDDAVVPDVSYIEKAIIEYLELS